MPKQIYAVYDRVAQDITGGLMVFTHDAPAVRIFVDALGDESTILNKHPNDFELVCLGEFDNPDGRIELTGYLQHRSVLTGEAWKAGQQAQVEVLR